MTVSSVATRVRELIASRLEDESDSDLEAHLSEGEGENPDEFEPPIQMDETFPTTVLVCNIPCVGKEKHDRLILVMGKIFDKCGENEKYMPINPNTEKTDGFMIIKFQTKEGAENAVNTLHGTALDRSHKFHIVPIDKFNDMTHRSQEFTPQRTLTCHSREDFMDWIADPQCREQFLIRYQNETEIHWHDAITGTPQLFYGGEREKREKKIWCDWKVEWSPKGSYLATFHAQGVALWGGNDFSKKVRFPHASVKFIEFSPNENFILTWNGSTALDNDEDAVRIFHVLTGQQLKKFKTPSVSPLGSNTIFPFFLWSHDSEYFAECNDTTIYIRDTKTFGIISNEEGKPCHFKYHGLATFQWSPKDNLVAAWILEHDNNPARIVLIDVDQRQEIASRSRTNVEAQMHWQSEGDYLCLVVTKLTGKAKKKGITNLEIFRVRQKQIPADIVEVKDNVRVFCWETKGSRFAILTADESGHRPKLCLYAIEATKTLPLISFDMPSAQFNNIFWAPDGQYFVAAAVKAGELLFCQLGLDNKFEVLRKDEHFMLTDVQWDPSSRYVMTAVTQPMNDNANAFKYQMEAGVSIWTFQGRALYREQKEKLWHVSWRPHPAPLLSKQRRKYITNNIKEFSKKYNALDDEARDRVREAFKKERDAKTDLFNLVLDRISQYKEEKLEGGAAGWRTAWDDFYADLEWGEEDQIIEDTLEVIEELIPNA